MAWVFTPQLMKHEARSYKCHLEWFSHFVEKENRENMGTILAIFLLEYIGFEVPNSLLFEYQLSSIWLQTSWYKTTYAFKSPAISLSIPA